MGLTKPTRLLFDAASRGDALAVRMFIRQRLGPFAGGVARLQGWIFGPRLHAHTLTEQGLRTPLMQAAARGHLDCVQALLPSCPTWMLSRVLACSVEAAAAGQDTGFWWILPRFLRTGRGFDLPLAPALALAARASQEPVLTALLDVPPGPPDDGRAQALRAAAVVSAEVGALGCLQRLHARDATVLRAQHREGYTLVGVAAREGHLECLRWLLDHEDVLATAGNPQAASDPFTNAPVHRALCLAATHGQALCALLLLERRVEPEQRPEACAHAALLCLHYNHLECATTLCEGFTATELESLQARVSRGSETQALAPLIAIAQRRELEDACIRSPRERMERAPGAMPEDETLARRPRRL